MTRICVILLALLAASLTSCASIVSKSIYPVALYSNPAGATIIVTDVPVRPLPVDSDRATCGTSETAKKQGESPQLPPQLLVNREEVRVAQQPEETCSSVLP